MIDVVGPMWLPYERPLRRWCAWVIVDGNASVPVFGLTKGSTMRKLRRMYERSHG